MNNQILTSSSIENKTPRELHTYLLGSISFTKTGFMLIGKLLHKLKEDEAFLDAVGEGIDTWDDYIGQPEIGLSRGEANRLTQIYEEFVLKLRFDEEYVASIPLKNLHYLLPIIKGGNTEGIDELVADAKELSQKDFKERIYESKTDSQDRTYEYLLMKRCLETGNMSKVHEFDSEQIKIKFNLK